MKRFVLLLYAIVPLVALSACGALSPTTDTDAQAVEQTAQAFAADAQAAAETATAAALVTETPTETQPPTETAVPPTATISPLELTLAAAGTQQAPTIQAGQTLAALTQAVGPATATPSPTPLLLEALVTVTEQTIIEDDVEIQVTQVIPPAKPLSQAWAEVYFGPAGQSFTVTTDEEAMALAITNSMAAAGFGENVSDLSVSLNNNLVTVEFTVTVGASGEDGRISYSAFVQNGQVVVTLTSLAFGRFTVPPDLLDGLNAALAQAMTGASDTAQAQVTVTDLFIDNGQMIVSGTVGPPS